MSRERSAEIVIDADAATIFDVLADPSQHSLFDGSDSVRGKLSGPPRLYLGATFAMRMRIVAPYLVRNVCVEFEEDKRIAWRHLARHIWRYELEPVDGSSDRTKVTETFDYRPAPLAAVYDRIGVPAHNLASIEATLQRLKVLVESRVKTAG
jgi:hypothetical protein